MGSAVHDDGRGTRLGISKGNERKIHYVDNPVGLKEESVETSLLR
jgi:hypothetical protein